MYVKCEDLDNRGQFIFEVEYVHFVHLVPSDYGEYDIAIGPQPDGQARTIVYLKQYGTSEPQRSICTSDAVYIMGADGQTVDMMRAHNRS